MLIRIAGLRTFTTGTKFILPVTYGQGQIRRTYMDNISKSDNDSFQKGEVELESRDVACGLSLKDQKCIACHGGMPSLQGEILKGFLKKLNVDWKLNDLGHLERSFTFKDFLQSMLLANKIAELAEQEGHHPDLHISWGKCGVEIWTHKINGLSESDFILAAKIDALSLKTQDQSLTE